MDVRGKGSRQSDEEIKENSIIYIDQQCQRFVAEKSIEWSVGSKWENHLDIGQDQLHLVGEVHSRLIHRRLNDKLHEEVGEKNVQIRFVFDWKNQWNPSMINDEFKCLVTIQPKTIKDLINVDHWPIE